MARYRTLKIGFFVNEDLCSLSPHHRLLFAGLWLLADRNGILEDRPKRIGAELFPYEHHTLDIHAMLDDLARGDDPFVTRERTHDHAYLVIRKFGNHQQPHQRERSRYLIDSQTLKSSPKKDQAGRKKDQAGRKLPVSSQVGSGIWDLGSEVPSEPPVLDVPAARPSQPKDLQLLWNTLTTEPLPKCRELGPGRRRGAAARLRERTLDDWRLIIDRIEKSDWCRGDNDRSWKADFDFLLKPDTAARVLEGKYDNRPKKHVNGKAERPKGPSVPGIKETSELLAMFDEPRPPRPERKPS